MEDIGIGIVVLVGVCVLGFVICCLQWSVFIAFCKGVAFVFLGRKNRERLTAR